MRRELAFYDELIILKTSKTSRGYARNYSIEIIDSKHPLVHLIISKPGIEYLFEYLLNQMKGFKYQTTPKVLLSKYKEKTTENFLMVIFYSTTKTAINSKYGLHKSFQKVFNRTDNWISEG